MCHSLSPEWREAKKGSQKGRKMNPEELDGFFLSRFSRLASLSTIHPPAKLHKRISRTTEKIRRLIKFTSRDKGRHDLEIWKERRKKKNLRWRVKRDRWTLSFCSPHFRQHFDMVDEKFSIFNSLEGTFLIVLVEPLNLASFAESNRFDQLTSSVLGAFCIASKSGKSENFFAENFSILIRKSFFPSKDAIKRRINEI